MSQALAAFVGVSGAVAFVGVSGVAAFVSVSGVVAFVGASGVVDCVYAFSFCIKLQNLFLVFTQLVDTWSTCEKWF